MSKLTLEERRQRRASAKKEVRIFEMHIQAMKDSQRGIKLSRVVLDLLSGKMDIQGGIQKVGEDFYYTLSVVMGDAEGYFSCIVTSNAAGLTMTWAGGGLSKILHNPSFLPIFSREAVVTFCYEILDILEKLS